MKMENIFPDDSELFSNITLEVKSMVVSSAQVAKSVSWNLTSTTNKTQQLLATKSWMSNDLAKIIPFYIVIFLLSVIGNSLVILTLVQSRRMRTVTNLFLLNLAVSDLFLGVFCMPFTLVGSLLRNFIFGEFMCKLLPFMQGKTRDK